jgi:hypothetical protein
MSNDENALFAGLNPAPRTIFSSAVFLPPLSGDNSFVWFQTHWNAGTIALKMRLI